MNKGKNLLASALILSLASLPAVAGELSFEKRVEQISAQVGELGGANIPLPVSAVLERQNFPQTKTNWWFYKIRTTCGIENGKAVGWITNNGSDRIDGNGKVEFHFYDAAYRPLGISKTHADVSIAPMRHHRMEKRDIPGNAAYCALNVQDAVPAPEKDFWTTNNACRINDGTATGVIFNTTPDSIRYKGYVEINYYTKDSVLIKEETVSSSGRILPGGSEVFKFNMIPGNAASCTLNPEINEFSFTKTNKPPVIGSYGWRHANLKAADGTEINVDYNVFRAGDGLLADPIWVNVSNPAFCGGERARVVLINSSLAGQSTQTLDLEYAGQGRFTARAGRVWIIQPEANFSQEIAVVVDGKWLTDPVSGSNNFKFRMTW